MKFTLQPSDSAVATLTLDDVKTKSGFYTNPSEDGVYLSDGTESGVVLLEAWGSVYSERDKDWKSRFPGGGYVRAPETAVLVITQDDED